VELVSVIKVCLNETCSGIRVGKYFSNTFLLKKWFKNEVLSPLVLYRVLEYAITGVQVNQKGLKLNGAHELMVHVDDVRILGRGVHNVGKSK
jgi:hypothetical protein